MKITLHKQLLKKVSAILLITVMTAAIFAACDESDINDTTTTIMTSENDLEQENEELPNLHDYNFGGDTLKIIAPALSASIWSSRDVVAEEQTGDPVNDAVYTRNVILQEQYNFTVEPMFVLGGMDLVRRAVAAGDAYFDVFSFGIARTSELAQEGCFVDLFDVHYLDFEKPWWNQGAVAGMTIGSRLFFASSDFLLVNRRSLPAVLFNKKLLKDLQLENPYELVRNAQWTISKLYEMARAGAADLDGDGEMTWDIDRFGFVPGATGNLPHDTRRGRQNRLHA